MAIEYGGPVNIYGSNRTKNRKRHWCFCCWIAALLALLLLFLSAIYFFEQAMSWTYDVILSPFGQKEFSIVVPANERHVDICVRDFGCEDGDKIRVTVNSNVIFSGEIYRELICKSTINITEGVNTVEMYAINGTGGKGHCPNNINTGEIIIMNINEQSQAWHQYADEKTTATLNITVE